MKSVIMQVVIICLGMSVAQADDQYRWRHNMEDLAEWVLPDCDRITGTGAFTFTLDEGVTLAKTSSLHGTVYSHGLAVLDKPNTLLAASMGSDGTEILRSEDAGCSWLRVDLIQVSGLLRLVAGPDGIVYGYSSGRSTIYRIVDDAIVALSAPANVYGLAVDPEDDLHIRIGCTYGQLYESFNGGAGFAALGGPASTSSALWFDVTFNHDSWDEVLCGGLGAWRTEDAGQTWSPIAPFVNDDLNMVYRFLYSPANSQRVWARANLDTTGAGYREILVSDDGGATFQTAVRQGDVALDQFGLTRSVTLTNQPPMAVHPVEDVLYFVFGTYYQGYGTDLFKYDLSQGELTAAHIDELDGIDAMAFHPVDPSVMYLGLEEEQIAKLRAEESRLQMNAAPNAFNPTTTIGFDLP